MSDSRTQIRTFSGVFFYFVKLNPAENCRIAHCFMNTCILTKIILYKPILDSNFKIKLKFNQIQYWILLKFRFAICNL